MWFKVLHREPARLKGVYFVGESPKLSEISAYKFILFAVWFEPVFVHASSFNHIPLHD